MAKLVYQYGQRTHLFAVRQLLPNPNDDDAYVAGPLVAVYGSSNSSDVIRQTRQESLVFPPYVVVHVTGYMLALAHQGPEGFRVWVIEPGDHVVEQYVVSLLDMVRANWVVRKTREFHQ